MKELYFRRIIYTTASAPIRKTITHITENNSISDGTIVETSKEMFFHPFTVKNFLDLWPFYELISKKSIYSDELPTTYIELGCNLDTLAIIEEKYKK